MEKGVINFSLKLKHARARSILSVCGLSSGYLVDQITGKPVCGDEKNLIDNIYDFDQALTQMIVDGHITEKQKADVLCELRRWRFAENRTDILRRMEERADDQTNMDGIYFQSEYLEDGDLVCFFCRDGVVIAEKFTVHEVAYDCLVDLVGRDVCTPEQALVMFKWVVDSLGPIPDEATGDCVDVMFWFRKHNYRPLLGLARVPYGALVTEDGTCYQAVASQIDAARFFESLREEEVTLAPGTEERIKRELSALHILPDLGEVLKRIVAVHVSDNVAKNSGGHGISFRRCNHPDCTRSIPHGFFYNNDQSCFSGAVTTNDGCLMIIEDLIYSKIVNLEEAVILVWSCLFAELYMDYESMYEDEHDDNDLDKVCPIAVSATLDRIREMDTKEDDLVN